MRWRKQGDRYVVLVAHSDFMKTHLIFEKRKAEIKSFRHAKENMFVFDSRNCVLSINTSGRGDADKKKYIEIFGDAILGMDQADESTFNNMLVALDPIKNGSFDYSGNDNIEYVLLTKTRLKCRGIKGI